MTLKLAVVGLMLLVCVHLSQAIRCKACHGIADTDCHTNPAAIPHTIECARCGIFARFYQNGKKLYDIDRLCADTVVKGTLPAKYENSCKTDSSAYIECLYSCDDKDLCTVDLSIVPPGWGYKDGKLVFKSDESNSSINTASVMLMIVSAIAFFTVY